MELITFAVDDGFAEAILRGLRSSFITLTQYTQMKTSNNLTDLKSVSIIFKDLFFLLEVKERIRIVWEVILSNERTPWKHVGSSNERMLDDFGKYFDRKLV